MKIKQTFYNGSAYHVATREGSLKDWLRSWAGEHYKSFGSGWLNAFYFWVIVTIR